MILAAIDSAPIKKNGGSSELPVGWDGEETCAISNLHKREDIFRFLSYSQFFPLQVSLTPLLSAPFSLKFIVLTKEGNF
ncbi:hypothetical protein D5R40_06875 [Okeania hirsuta]|uniref:Uncharacterized protein n=1 Tax=Okeania hirsuta TaxID=1458930 RepID=A0A3N6P118_9CYAN|nr:hypothetical protein D4Z78_00050 [Okeania hirsuta]RQH49893.1 hypothetical protein D5R40_06875 [Okeania hirsuta]